MRMCLITKDISCGTDLIESLRPFGLEAEVLDAGSTNLCDDCRSRSPDVLLVDLSRLPYKVDRLIQSIHDSNPLAEIIALYSSIRSAPGVNAIRSGVFDCLPKSASIETLSKKLQAAYRRKILNQRRLDALRSKEKAYGENHKL